jgi:hypothetical protein
MVGKFPGRERVFCSAHLEVAFDAEHIRPILPVETALKSAGEAGRPGQVVLDGTPSVAEVAADIGAEPAIAVGSQWIGDRLRIGDRWGALERGWGIVIGSADLRRRAHGQQRDRAQNEPFHLNSPTQLTSRTVHGRGRGG